VVEQTKDSIPDGVCFAPLRAYIPNDLWCHLPEWFLSSALLDSYDSERRLLEMYPGRYENTFVKPSAGRPQPILYRSANAVVRNMQQWVPAAIFATMVDWDIVKGIEENQQEIYM